MEGVRIRLTIKPPHSDLQKREGGEMGTSKGRGGRRKCEPTSTIPLFPVARMFIGVWARDVFNYESTDTVGAEGKNHINVKPMELN